MAEETLSPFSDVSPDDAGLSYAEDARRSTHAPRVRRVGGDDAD